MDDGRIEVSHGKIIEGGKVKVVCPKRSAGQGVYLSCEGGYINVTESTCKRSSFCHAGWIDSGNASVFHDKLDDLENMVLRCPEGFSGSLDVTCNKGEVSILGDTGCHQNCPAGRATLDGLQVEHSDLQHGQQVELACPEHYIGRFEGVSIEMDRNGT